MDPAQTTHLFFSISDDDRMGHVVRELSAVFHVVPAELSDADGRVLSVEIAPERPELVDGVRQLVAESDPASVELPRPESAMS